MGSDTETKVAYVTLTSKPIAAFVVRPKEVLQLAPFSDETGTKVKLYDKSTFYGSYPSTWSWSVTSTGKTTQTSTKQNPEITLPVEAGLNPVYWTVTLTVTDALGVTSDPAVVNYAIVQRTVKP